MEKVRDNYAPHETKNVHISEILYTNMMEFIITAWQY